MEAKKRGGRRRGAGRPNKYGAEKTQAVTISIPAGLVDSLTKTAANNGLSRSELITFILRNKLGAK